MMGSLPNIEEIERALEARRVLVRAETDFYNAVEVFGEHSAEAKVAWQHWEALSLRTPQVR